MKKILLTVFVYGTAGIWGKPQAQILKVSPGSDLTIVGGTIFSADSLIITPSADYTLSNTNLVKASAVINSMPYNYIKRVYQFSGSTNPFSGSVQLYYLDGAELNGIPESGLTLDIDNGSSWNVYPATTRNSAQNYVFTSGVSSLSLNELTLGDPTYILPLVWVSFTATKQNRNVLLRWIVEQEENTRNYTVQYSSNGIAWTNMSTLLAFGNGGGTRQYMYIHTNPVQGNNYYRIIQTDFDNKVSFSDVRTVNFAVGDVPFTVNGNPVTSGILKLEVNTEAVFSLYTADGILLFKKKLSTGIQNVDVSKFSGGTYLLTANGITKTILIQ